jgi:fluoroquinolone transport system permease protein
MKTFLALSSYELKNISRDNMTFLMAIYPVFITLIGAYVIPLIMRSFETPDATLYISSLVIIIVLASMAPMLAGAMLGFLLLDHKDERTLDSLRVTPLSLRSYLIFKASYTYVLAAVASALVILGVRLLSGDSYTFMGQNVFRDLPLSGIILYAFVGGLFGPVFGLLIATLAKNKIEGFAYLKSIGIIIILPVLVMLETLQDFKQYFIGIIPGFWPVKGLLESASILSNPANLPPALYFFIGLVFMLGLIVVFIHQFQKVMSK